MGFEEKGGSACVRSGEHWRDSGGSNWAGEDREGAERIWGHQETGGHTGGNKMVGNVDEHRQTAGSTTMLRIATADCTHPDHRSGMRSKSVSAHAQSAQSAQIVRGMCTTVHKLKSSHGRREGTGDHHRCRLSLGLHFPLIASLIF